MRRATRSTSGGSRALLNRSSLEENLKKLKIARLKKAAREAAMKNASEVKHDKNERNSRVIKKEEPDEAPEEYATPRQSIRKKKNSTEELVEKHAAKKNIDQGKKMDCATTDVLDVVRRSARRTPREEEHREDIDEQKELQKELLNPAVDDTYPTESISNQSILSISSSSVSQSPKRSFRIKKEVSICGVTCTCCVHTSLQRLKKKREPQTPSRAPEIPSKPSKSSETPSTSTPPITPTPISIQGEKTPEKMLSTKNLPRRNSSRARKPSFKTLDLEEPIELERNARGRSSTRSRRPSVRTFALEEPKESEIKTRGRSSSRPRKPSARIERKKLDFVVKTEPEPGDASISPPPLLQREDMLAQEPIQGVIVKEEIEDEAESVASKTRRPSRENDTALEDVYDIENEMRALKETKSRETTPSRKPIKSKERRRVIVEESSMSDLTSEDDVKPDTVAEVRRRRKKIGKSRLLTRMPKKSIRREKEIPSEDIFLQQNLGFGGIDKEAVMKEYEELEEVFVEMFSISHKKTANAIEKLASSEQNIEYVVLGGVFHMKTWYRGSYPCEYSLLSCIHICDGCFAYFRTAKICAKHMELCEMRAAPPGNEIYKDVNNNVSVFQVDGEKFPGYCSNLCLLTMLWLRDKIVYADVHPFFFYVVTNTSKGYYRTVGYFSKQKFTTHPQNLSCMCVLPCYQGNRLGSFIVDFSYLLSRLEDLPGGPEHPLSTLGELTYRKYWTETLMRYFYVAVQDATKRGEDVLNLEDIIKATGMRAEDIADTIGMMFKSSKTKKEKNTFTLTWDRELVMREGARLEKEYHQKLFAREKYVNPKFVAEIEARKSCKWSWPSTCVEVMRRSDSDSDSDSD